MHDNNATHFLCFLLDNIWTDTVHCWELIAIYLGETYKVQHRRKSTADKQ